MCTGNTQPGLSAPGSVAEALAAAHRSVDYLNAAAGGSELAAAAIGDVLRSLGVLRAKSPRRTRGCCASSAGTGSWSRRWPAPSCQSPGSPRSRN